jgi:hypothetical protein
MRDNSALLGRWSAFGRMIEVVADGDGLLLRYPGVPAGFAPRATAVDGDLRLRGGPFHGSSLRVEERDGLPHLVFGGTVTLPPWSAEPDVTRFVEGLPVAPVAVDPAVEPAYRALLDQVRSAGGTVVSPPAEVPLGAWLRWASDEQAVLFHGRRGCHRRVRAAAAVLRGARRGRSRQPRRGVRH